jgi:hypothetical protein
VLRWLWYAVGGGLPAEYREWVLYDVTCRTWPLRHLVRLLVQLVPVGVLLIVLLPVPLWIRVLGVVVGSSIGLLYSFVFLYEATERRATKAGYPSGTAQVVRQEQHAARALRKAADDFHRSGGRRPHR